MIGSVNPKPISLEFQGKAGEYFRIWIVNILLTIVTLGIYSAWAKVRNKQYFYGNTLLNDSPFRYSANPVTLLKGRLIVATILVAYSICVQFYPQSDPIFILLFLLFMPWLVMRSLMFNARYSSYRNINFTFRKSLGAAIKTFLGLTLLIPFTLGLIYPYYAHEIQSYRVNHHSFGQLLFHKKYTVKAFYKYYFIALLTYISGAALIFFAINGALVLPGTAQTSDSPGPVISPAAAYQLFSMSILYFILYMLAYAYISANVYNNVWSNTTLDRELKHNVVRPHLPVVHFHATLNPWKLFWIYISNLLAIISSVGLAIPWSKIRLARYRIENLEVRSIAEFQKITAAEKSKTGAIGSEMSDILDLDFGL